MRSEREPSSKGSTWALAILLGWVLASIQQEASGFLIGAMLGVLLAQVLHLRGRIRFLSDQVQALKQTERASAASTAGTTAPEQPFKEAHVASPPSADEPTTKVDVPQRAEVFAEPAVVASVPRDAGPAEVSTAAPVRRAPEPSRAQPSLLDTLVSRSVAWLKAGNPLARLGIVILFFGGAFLAKYAADHSLFPIELRFIAIAMGAFALLLVGWRLRERRAVYAQLLQGGGIAGLYLTVFAAASLYDLLPLGAAFALMVVIALCAAVLAVAQNALSLAVIGTAGGFMAPLLVSTGSGNHVALFSYYAVLNVGVFAVAWFRTWRVLNVLGFLFTFVITGLWRATGFEVHELASADSSSFCSSSCTSASRS
jgi:uncharacterized membrane protein